MNHVGSHISLSVFFVCSSQYFTALGGGIARVRDPVLYKAMKALLETQPITPDSDYAAKIAKVAPVMTVLNSTMLSAVGMRAAHAFNYDYKTKAVTMLRGTQSKNVLLAHYH